VHRGILTGLQHLTSPAGSASRRPRLCLAGSAPIPLRGDPLAVSDTPGEQALRCALCEAGGRSGPRTWSGTGRHFPRQR